MAPTCDSFSEETSSSCPRSSHEASSSSSTSSSNPRLPAGSPPTSGLSPAELMLAVTAEEEEDYDSEPFYGMFSSRLDEDAEDCWAAVRLGGKTSTSTSSSIPEASETFQRAMQQLDGVGPKVQPPSAQTQASGSSCGGARPKDRKPTPTPTPTPTSTTKRGDRKSSKPVKKSASFSAAATTSTSSSASASSSSASSSSGSCSEAARRRMSMPCMRDDKRHVQWADEAGVSNLVSVRLIRPRLAKAEEDSPAHCPGRSILRRLSGIH